MTVCISCQCIFLFAAIGVSRMRLLCSQTADRFLLARYVPRVEGNVLSEQILFPAVCLRRHMLPCQ